MAKHGQPYSIRKNGDYYYYRLEGSKAYKTTGSRNPAEAKAIARAKWEEAQKPKANPDQTLLDALQPFYTEDCPHGSRLIAEGKSFGDYHRVQARAVLVANVFKDKLAKMKLAEIKRADILEFRTRLLKLHGQTRKVQKTMAALKTCIKELYFQELMDRDPTAGIGQIKLPTAPQRDSFTKEEIQRLFEGRPGNFPSCLAYDLFRFAALSGMRRGEILALQWDQVDLVSNVIKVMRAVKNAGREIGAPKWGKVRVTPIIPEAREILLRQEPAGPFVFHYPDGQNLGGTFWQKAISKALKTAGIDRPGIVAHSFRHTLNSAWRAAGVPDFIIRSALGWTSEQVQDGYSHIKPEDYIGLPGV